MPFELRIRSMEFDDIKTIKGIEERSFPSPYSSAIWERERRNSLSRTLVIVADKGEDLTELVGYLNFWIILDEAEIHRIAVKEEYRRSGAASALLCEMLKELRGKDMRSVHLEVRQSNQGAIKLYEKMGFVIKGRRPGYYDETGEDALILNADLKGTKQE